MVSEGVVCHPMPSPNVFILLFEIFFLFFLLCIDMISLFFQYIMTVTFSLPLMHRVT